MVWSVLALLLVRGAADLLSTSKAAAPATSSSKPVTAEWPDDEARAFAVDFTRGYLSYSPQHPERYTRGLLPLVAPEVASSVVPRFARRGSGQVVEDAVVAHTVPVGPDRALVTVAASVVGRDVGTRFLTVPVARDAHGGLVVYDPAVVLAAARAGPTQAGGDRAAVRCGRGGGPGCAGAVLPRFPGRRSADLEYFVPAGTRIRALAQRYELAGVDAVEQLSARGGRRVVLVTVRARDVVSRATYPLRYRVELERRDRWYVAAVNAIRKEG